MLIASLKKEIQTHITEGISLTWDTYRLEHYVQKMTQLSNYLSERVSSHLVFWLSSCYCMQIIFYLYKTEELALIEQQIVTHLNELDTCLYDSCTIANILDRIQSCVDDLGMKMYSNLPKWVSWLDQEVLQSQSKDHKSNSAISNSIVTI